MERQEILAIMDELKLAGMRAAFDEVLANGLKRQHPVPRIVGDLLKAEIAEKQYPSAGGRLSRLVRLSEAEGAAGVVK